MYELRPIYAYSICRWPRSKCVVSEHIIMWKHLYSDDWHWQQCYVSNRLYSMSNQLHSPFFSMSNEMKSNPTRKGHIFNKIDWNKVRNLSLCQMSLLIFAFPICRSSSVSAEKTSCVVSSSRAIYLKFNGWNVKRMISLGALSIFCSFLPSLI